MIASIPPILKEDFPKLESLNLSFNLISPTSIRSLFKIARLKILDLSGNNLMTFPEDMMELKCLEELNLSSNLFSSQSALVNPALLIKAIGQMPKLKRLNMSRNKFQFFHSEYLDRDEDFPFLQELDMSYNAAESEDNFMSVSQLKNVQLLVITGNPFAMMGKEAYFSLENVLQKNLSAAVVNDEVTDSRTYLRKANNKKGSSFPYPNPIKLFSREV
jgi:Leucine-rich repeat (LRR) protein